MFVTPQNISYDENIITYTMQLIFADRINDDMSNEIDVVSDMDIQARRFMSYIRRGMNQDPPLWNYMDCNLPLTGLPFLERFNDYVGGISIDMEVIIRTDINACDYYELSPSPTPSITPTNTPTPTITPTNTGTPTPTPTPTLTPGLVSKSMAVRVFDTTNSNTITGATFSIDINSQNYNFSPLNNNTVILCESGFTGVYSGLTYSLELNIPNGWQVSQTLGGFLYDKLEITFDIELTPNSVWQTTFNYYLSNTLISSSQENLTINASGFFSCPINNFTWITNQGFQFYVKPTP